MASLFCRPLGVCCRHHPDAPGKPCRLLTRVKASACLPAEWLWAKAGKPRPADQKAHPVANTCAWAGPRLGGSCQCSGLPLPGCRLWPERDSAWLYCSMGNWLPSCSSSVSGILRENAPKYEVNAAGLGWSPLLGKEGGGIKGGGVGGGDVKRVSQLIRQSVRTGGEPHSR